ncbi:MAG TPA: hypothetical protein VFG63_03885, partial [Nocardioidaceae bacterium]|nr:hypothetical protein [Nocardioidaceae bacterium]
PMTTFHHRIKTFSAWQLRQPFPGLYLWKSPQNQYYLVDHTGTRTITTSTATTPAATGKHNPDLALEIYPHHGPLDYEYTHSA